MPSTQVAWYNVNVDYGGSVRAALEAAKLAGGGVVYLPARVQPYVLDAGGPLVIPYPNHPPGQPPPLQPITLLGDGAGASILTTTPGYADDILRIQRAFVTLDSLTLDGVPGSRDAIVFGQAEAVISALRITDCIIRGAGRHCLYSPGFPATPETTECTYTRTVFGNNRAPADPLYTTACVQIEGSCTAHEFRDCVFSDFYGPAVRLTLCSGISFYACVFRRQAAVQANRPGYYLYGVGAQTCQVRDCVFDDTAYYHTPADWYIGIVEFPDQPNDVGSDSWTIDSTTFYRYASGIPRAVLVRKSKATVILNPRILANSGNDHIKVEGAGECMLVGGLTNLDSDAEVRVFADNTGGTPKIQLLTNRRLRLTDVAGSPPPDNHVPSDLIVDGGVLKLWTAAGWRAIQHD